MPDHIAFLRAINLGAQRKFPKADIVAATEAAGGRDVETYINTGNVRLDHSARSVAKVQSALEAAYAAEAGFEVPTVVFTTADLAAVTARAEELHAEHAPSGQHYVTLFATAPAAAAESQERATGASTCTCGSGDSSGCGPDCACGS